MFCSFLLSFLFIFVVVVLLFCLYIYIYLFIYIDCFVVHIQSLTDFKPSVLFTLVKSQTICAFFVGYSFPYLFDMVVF